MSTEQKLYCIGCKHLRYDKPQAGYDTECTSGIGKEDAALACNKGHWTHEFSQYGADVLGDFERAMKKAETCKDYQERESV